MSRIFWAATAALLLAVLIVMCLHQGWGATIFAVVFGVMPDVALIGAFGERGKLKPARVGFYNLLHAAPLALGVAVLAGLLGLLGVDAGVLAIVGTAWLAHIAVDRAAGYGLRAPDGTILPVSA